MVGQGGEDRVKVAGKMTLFVIAGLFLLAGGVSGCVGWSAERKFPPVGDFVTIDGRQIHYLDIGPRNADLPPVVLVHGASVNLKDMKLALGDVLAQDRRVVMIDRAGRGYTERRSGDWQLHQQADIVHAVVKELGLDDVLLVGQSYGGAVALAYAIDHQASLSGLVLLAPVSHEWPGGVAWYNTAAGVPGFGLLFRRLVLPIYANFAAEGSVRESFAPDTAPENYYERAGVPLLFRSKDFKSNAEDIRNLKAEIVEQSSDYSQIQIPTLIMAGEADSTVSPQIHAETLAKEIADAVLVPLPETGHALHHAETDRILAEIKLLFGGAS